MLLVAYRRAQPPPGTIPCSAAALVAHNASLILSFNSFTSVSLTPPTFKIATPPVSFASLSWNLSLS
jgi:flavin reductase (DIM6/NTAB) family NADH-FMN oxidoreductase RutF